MEKVSVSFRSSILFNYIKENGIEENLKEFPSPFGVQFFLMCNHILKFIYLEVFGFRLLSEFNSF